MAWYYILLIVLASLLLLVLLIFYVAIPLYLVQYMSYPKRWNRDETHKNDLDDGLLDGEEQLERKPLELKMSDGYLLHGDISLQGDKKKFVILCHGYSANRECELKYALMFYSLGYSIVLYDHRSHGDNVRKDVTMGYKEAKDLHEVICWLKREYGEDIFLGLQGESMGAATVLQVVQYHDKIDFICEDCGYGDVSKLFNYLIRHMMHLSPFFVPMCDFYMKLLHGYHMKEASPLTYIKGSKIPLLVIHGECDTFIPKEHAEDIYKAFEGYKEIHFIPNAEHAASLKTDRVEYRKILTDFVKKVEQDAQSDTDI